MVGAWLALQVPRVALTYVLYEYTHRFALPNEEGTAHMVSIIL